MPLHGHPKRPTETPVSGRAMTKAEASTLQTHLVPSWAFDAVNELVATRLGTDNETTISFPDLSFVVKERGQTLDYRGGDYPNIVNLILASYRSAGWKITLDRPDYTENRATMVTFK